MSIPAPGHLLPLKADIKQKTLSDIGKGADVYTYVIEMTPSSPYGENGNGVARKHRAVIDSVGRDL